MANPEHLQLLKQVGALNSYRRENPEVKIDLSGADLSGANLTETILRGADLSGAYLREADLSGANLTDATGLNPAKLVFAALSNTRGLPPELQEQILAHLKQGWQSVDEHAPSATRQSADT